MTEYTRALVTESMKVRVHEGMRSTCICKTWFYVLRCGHPSVRHGFSIHEYLRCQTGSDILVT